MSGEEMSREKELLNAIEGWQPGSTTLKSKTFTEITTEIGELDFELDGLYHSYRNLKAEIDALDKEIMDRNRAKWALERQLIKVTKCPTYKPRESSKVIKAEKEIDLKDLSMDEILRVLKQLKRQGV